MIGTRIPHSVALAALALSAAACGGGGGAAPAGDSPATGAPARSASAPEATATGGTARITGVVRFEGQVPDLKPVNMSADPGCAAKHGKPVPNEVLVLGEGETLVNAFVEVTGGLPPGSWPVPAQPVVLDQQGCRYVPHVVGVMVGQSLEILNSDGLMHNVHALPTENKPFNKAMPPGVTETEHVFSKVEPAFKIKCDVHPWMGAWITVTDHPFFAVSGGDGTFTIAGLPAGSYTLEARHERLKTASVSVTVADGETASVELTLRP